MSKITEELKELAQIACTLGKANGSVEVRTSRSPEYQDRDLFKKLKETIQEKIDALARIPDAEYVAIVTGADKETTIVGDWMSTKELGETIKRIQERMAKGASFSEAAKPEIKSEDPTGQAMFDEMESEKIIPPEKEPLDSVEQHTIKT
jgi:hypothetical protein